MWCIKHYQISATYKLFSDFKMMRKSELLRPHPRSGWQQLKTKILICTEFGIIREADCKYRASDGNSKFSIFLKLSWFKALNKRRTLVKNKSILSDGSRDIQAYTVAIATSFRPVKIYIFSWNLKTKYIHPETSIKYLTSKEHMPKCNCHRTL